MTPVNQDRIQGFGFRNPLLPFISIGLLAAATLLKGTMATGAPADSSKDQAKWRLAGLAAARQVLDDLDQSGTFSDQERLSLVESLNEAMRRDVQAHVSRADSRRLAASLAARIRRQSIEQRFQSAIQHGGEQSPLPVTRADVIAILGPGWTNKLEKAIDSFSGPVLDPIFNDARARAVGLQRQELEQKLKYPPEAELNTLLTNRFAAHPSDLRLNAGDLEAIQARLVSLAIPDNKPCFEELTASISDVTRRITAEIRRQFERQLSASDDAAQGIPATTRQKVLIAKALEEAAESDLSRERAKPALRDPAGSPVPLYGLFIPIRNRIPILAGQIEESRVQAFIETTPVLTLDSDSLSKAIRAAPGNHLTPANSTRIFAESLPAPSREKASASYAAEAIPPGQGDYFAGLFETNPAITKTFQKRLGKELERQLPPARRIVSDEQFKKHFGAADNRNPLPDDVLVHLKETGAPPLKTLSETFQILKTPDPGNRPLLEETVNRVLALANRKAREGHDVILAQEAIVGKLERDKLDKLKQDVTARRPFKQIRAEWKSAAETSWKADARSQSTPYNSLVGPSKTSLNKAVRQLYDSLQDTPAPVTTVAQHPASEPETGKEPLKQDPAVSENQNTNEKKNVQQPALTSPKAGGKEGAAATVLSRLTTSRRNEPDGILILKGGAGHSGQAHFMTPSGDGDSHFTFAPGKPREGAEAIFKAIQPQLETLWKSTAKTWQQEHSGFGILKFRTPPKLKLFVVIESEDVRHRMSILLRQRIDEAITEWHAKGEKGTPEVELDWKVGLTLTPAETEAPLKH